MQPVDGILETALHVHDPRASADFYRSAFGFRTLLDAERLIALNVGGRSVLLLFKEGETATPFSTPGGVIPGHTANGPTHFAMSIALADFAEWERKLASLGIIIESTVSWPTGAKSLYFRDPDENLVELITAGFWKLD